jgi:hypothetical protein
MTHDPARPGITEQRVVLATARAILNGADPGAVHEAARGEDPWHCPDCTVVAAVSFGVTIAQELAGAGFVNGPLAPRLLTLIDQAEADLRSMGN